ncbi:DUF5776 domain-containing protein [Levilactobacillus humaensis]|uniref:DUF5776 domain-containing protein n=1 Tax=Levilactobacillus humaensis TaxID=2950375 RepID=UPI0021C45E1D|nr:DUF5776 domain-containing protein [Levilactobacillus humaensis]
MYLEFTQPTTSDPDYGLILVDAEKIPQNEITKTTRYKDIWTVDSTYKRTMEDDKELLQAQVNYTNGIWRKKAINLVSKFAFGTEEPDKDQYTQLMAFFNDAKGRVEGYSFNPDNFDTLMDQPLPQLPIDGSDPISLEPYPGYNTPDADPTATTGLFTQNSASPVHVTYKSSDGKADLPDDHDLNGMIGTTITDSDVFPDIPGYTSRQKSITLTDKPQNLTVFYQKNPSVPSNSETDNGIGNSSFKVYGKQKFYRYKNVDFKKSERVQKYVKKPRIYAPVFTVVGTATSKAGNPRYKLSDGTYITAKSDYVAKLYWQKMTTQTMYVTNPKGIKTHATTIFNDQISRLKQGTAVPVTKLVKVGNVTRYELPDGTYITGSKCYVTPNKPKTVIKVQGRDGRNRYSDVNLNERLQHYKKGHVFKVTGWDYSHGWNTAVHGTKRYKVAGGYITGNPKLVKIVK